MPDTLLAAPGGFAAVAALFGLVVGSFLNVVIHRLPIMLEQRWRSECRELLEQGPEPATPTYNLIRPRSACPHCDHAIRAWQNIPVISYLLLRGRCAGCGARIPLRYPLVELLAAGSAAVVAWHWGPGWPALAAMGFTWTLIALAAIDLRHYILPDALTLPLLWAGLLVSLTGAFAATPAAAIAGAAAGYLVLWAVYHLFRLITGREGMGYGDFKLLAALGAWMGWTALPLVVLISSFVGAVFGIAQVLIQGQDRHMPIPFGPYLAGAGWITLLWGEAIISAYLGTVGT